MNWLGLKYSGKQPGENQFQEVIILEQKLSEYNFLHIFRAQRKVK